MNKICPPSPPTFHYITYSSQNSISSGNSVPDREDFNIHVLENENNSKMLQFLTTLVLCH